MRIVWHELDLESQNQPDLLKTNFLLNLLNILRSRVQRQLSCYKILILALVKRILFLTGRLTGRLVLLLQQSGTAFHCQLGTRTLC